MSNLKGNAEFKRRLKAVQKVWRPVAREWRDATVENIRPEIPVGETGITRRLLKKGRISPTRVTILGGYVTNFLNAGAVRHTYGPKRQPFLIFSVRGRTIYDKKVNHPGQRARHFKADAMRDAYEEVDVPGQVIKLWNEAA